MITTRESFSFPRMTNLSDGPLKPSYKLFYFIFLGLAGARHFTSRCVARLCVQRRTSSFGHPEGSLHSIEGDQTANQHERKKRVSTSHPAKHVLKIGVVVCELGGAGSHGAPWRRI
jgi:hypothetical protein